MAFLKKAESLKASVEAEDAWEMELGIQPVIDRAIRVAKSPQARHPMFHG